jgi:hypothetical protein
MTDSTTCAECSQPIEGEHKRLEYGSGKKVHHYHQPCWDEYVRRSDERRRLEEAERERKGRLQALDRTFYKSCVGYEITLAGESPALRRAHSMDSGWVLDGGAQVGRHTYSGPLRFPEWAWARFDNAEFRRRASPLILQAYEQYDPDRDGSFVALGKTGVAKSAGAVAFVQRRYAERRARVETGESLGFWFAWVSGFELAGARKRSPLGEESPLVKHATEIPLLILDEVGHEPQSEELMTVIDSRYRANLPTIVTSPLTWQELAQHIGGGAYRRLLEHGVKADAHGEVVKGRVQVVR